MLGMSRAVKMEGFISLETFLLEFIGKFAKPEKILCLIKYAVWQKIIDLISLLACLFLYQFIKEASICNKNDCRKILIYEKVGNLSLNRLYSVL